MRLRLGSTRHRLCLLGVVSASNRDDRPGDFLVPVYFKTCFELSFDLKFPGQWPPPCTCETGGGRCHPWRPAFCAHGPGPGEHGVGPGWNRHGHRAPDPLEEGLEGPWRRSGRRKTLEPEPSEKVPWPRRGRVGRTGRLVDAEVRSPGGGRGLLRKAAAFAFLQDKGTVQVKDPCPHASVGRAIFLKRPGHCAPALPAPAAMLAHAAGLRQGWARRACWGGERGLASRVGRRQHVGLRLPICLPRAGSPLAAAELFAMASFFAAPPPTRLKGPRGVGGEGALGPRGVMGAR